MATWNSARDANKFQIRLIMNSVGTPDTSGVRSQVRIRGYVVSNYAESKARGTGNGVLDGKTVATLKDVTRTVPLNGTLLLFDVTQWVSHSKTTGEKTVSGSVTYGTVNSGTPWGITRRTVSGSLKLPKITPPTPPDPPDPPAPPKDAYINLYADSYFVTQDGGQVYFDGDSPGANWDGTPHASKSFKVNANDTPLYDAYQDDNRIMSAEAGNPETYVIDSGYYAKEIFPPIPTNIFPCPPGTYYVSDSDNIPIVPSQWIAYGGHVQVEINEYGLLEVTITPPAEPIPGTNGQYYLASTDAQTRYGELKVNGIGVRTNPVTLTLPTGADFSKVNTELAQSLESPWIVERVDAYTAGNRMALKASGAAPSLSFSVSFSMVEELGITVGSIMRFKDGLYRVITASMRRDGVSLGLDPWTTVGAFDEVWGDHTVGEFDADWDGRYIRDFNQKPLRKKI